MKLRVLPTRAIYHGGILCKGGTVLEVDDELGRRFLAESVVEEIAPPKPKPKAKAKA